MTLTMNVALYCRDHNWNRIAFIGTAKHAGKTTALNGFIAEADALGLTNGICSIGLDGERLDTIMGVEKPAIIAPKGTLVVSAERALERSDANLEWIRATSIESPLGTVMLARVKDSGRVLLAGVRHRQHVSEVMRLLEAQNVDVSLVDGAFDRVAAATPGLVDAAILAVGAVSGKTVNDVVLHAYPFITRFLLEKVDPHVAGRLKAAHDEDKIGVLSGTKLSIIPKHQAVFGVTGHADFGEDADTLYVPGAITDSLLSSLLTHNRSLELIASHPAQILASGEMLRRFWRKNHRLSVWNSMPLAAIAVNPESILGYSLDRSELMDAIASIASGVPVYDARSVEGFCL